MKRNIILAYIFSTFFYFFVDLALWPIYLTEKKGFLLVHLGIFQAVLTLSRFIFEVPSGVFSDRFGRVKTMTISVLASILSNIFILFGQSVLLVSISYVCFGICLAFISGTFEAFVYDSLKSQNKEDNYKHFYTNTYVLSMVSMSVAMFLGGILTTINMDLMYVGNIISLSIALISCLLMIEPPVTNRQAITVKKIVHSSISTLKSNKYLLFLIAFTTITAAISNNTWHFSQKLLSDYGFSNMNVSYEAIFTTLMAGVAAKIAYHIEKRIGKLVFSIFVFASLSFPLIILGLSGNIYLILFVLTLCTMSISFADPIYSDYINKEIDSSSRATILSVQSLLSSIFALLYAAILGYTNNIAFSFIIVGFLSIPIYIYILAKIKHFQLN